MQKPFKWLLMLNKRLYKKAAFVTIMLFIPLCVFALGIAAEQQSGFVSIVLAREDNADPVSTELVNSFMSEKSLVRFTLAASPAEAVSEVKSGGADAAWIFPTDMKSEIEKYAATGSNKKPFIKVIEREENVFLRLTREKLSASLFGYSAKVRYIDFARTNIPDIDLTDAELIDYFDNVSVSEELFTIGSVGDFDTDGQGANYLVAPIRGILAILIMLCGMAATIFYMQDERSGTFALVKSKNRIYVSAACVMIAVMNIAAVTLLALFLSGIATAFLNELVSLILYALCCTAFCLLLMQIFRNLRLFAATIPLFVIAAGVFCPVFFDLRQTAIIGHLLPPTYYINAAYSNSYKLYMLLYLTALTALIIAFQWAKGKIRCKK